ncbi:NUDIX hydrolase [Chloroherpeton thalassium ATCC 35110]|uniref:NUDIX hydrolase n=1 Tax=Chloroherpeton thalassium (strain ATCC 35110 / GB-78) TaxID=517418 RepID=B3QVN3_CHLT3|nr:NUDIX domain-containing protein [Chloroherpeton thalassium]ACF13090.1 NUDIX hydrolase [Chloroherpeton thalassium ATCC 35110]
MYKTKISVKALILKQNQVLAIKQVRKKGVYYSLPGGKQKRCESLIETLVRECKEELGTEIFIDDLWALNDSTSEKEKADKLKRKHALEFVFRCEVPESYQIHNGPSPDKGQVSVEWIDIDTLRGVPFYPNWIKQALKERHFQRKIYHGLNPAYLFLLRENRIL